MQLNEFFNGTTYGLEIEAAGMRRDTDLMGLGEWCREEGSIINKKGIGNDPLGIYNILGGEIKVKYAHSEEELIDRALKLLEITKCPIIDMPSTMHVHIKVPYLYKDENLDVLKHIVMFTQTHYPTIAPIISPLPSMDMIRDRSRYSNDEQYKMFVRAYTDKYRSRHSIFTDKQIERIMGMTTFEDFINHMATYNPKTNKPMWNLHKRTGINFAKMRANDGATMEFRMFSASSDPEIINNIIKFPKKYLEFALDNDINNLMDYVKSTKWPDYYGWTNEEPWITHNWVNTDHDKIDRKHIIEYIRSLLSSGELTIDDLGRPKMWIDEGFK